MRSRITVQLQNFFKFSLAVLTQSSPGRVSLFKIAFLTTLDTSVRIGNFRRGLEDDLRFVFSGGNINYYQILK